MFRQLFNHIQENKIAMTAPVDMTYNAATDKPKVQSMSFLYDIPERGDLNDQGAVKVRDVVDKQMLSIGVRGRYNDAQFDAAMKQLDAWLKEQKQYVADGPPRFLGYNSPFVPFFWRYGEVQIPVRATNE